MKNYAMGAASVGHGMLVTREGVVLKVFKSGVRIARQGSHHGYKTVCNKSLKASGESRFVHRMVLEAFIGPKPDGMVAMHKNNNRSDNRVENLRWGTPSENQRQRSADGRCNRSALLTADDITYIRTSGRPLKEMAAKFGCTQTWISVVRSGKAGSHPRLK